MDNTKNIRLGLYIVGIVIVILSRITPFIEYNLAMTIASVILSITLFIDATIQFQKQHKVKATLLVLCGIILLLLLVYLWLYQM